MTDEITIIDYPVIKLKKNRLDTAGYLLNNLSFKETVVMLDCFELLHLGISNFKSKILVDFPNLTLEDYEKLLFRYGDSISVYAYLWYQNGILVPGIEKIIDHGLCAYLCGKSKDYDLAKYCIHRLNIIYLDNILYGAAEIGDIDMVKLIESYIFFPSCIRSEAKLIAKKYGKKHIYDYFVV